MFIQALKEIQEKEKRVLIVSNLEIFQQERVYIIDYKNKIISIQIDRVEIRTKVYYLLVSQIQSLVYIQVYIVFFFRVNKIETILLLVIYRQYIEVLLEFLEYYYIIGAYIQVLKQQDYYLIFTLLYIILEDFKLFYYQIV